MIRLRDLLPYFLALRALLIRLTVLVIGLFSIVWISGGLYGSFYYAYIPQQTYLLPVDFVFEPCGDSEATVSPSRCSDLTATVAFQLDKLPLGKENYLMLGQTYSISIDLEMPSNVMNQNVGMFLLCLTLESAEGREVGGNGGSRCKSSIMPHRSESWKTVWSILFPFKNYGGEEIVSVEFYDKFQDDVHNPVAKAIVEIKNRHIGISKASLRLHSHFRGLRYLMYHYPVTSAVLGILFISTVLFSLLILALGKVFNTNQVSHYNNEEQAKMSSSRSRQDLSSKLKKCSSLGKIARKVSDQSKSRVDFEEEETALEEPLGSHGGGGIEITCNPDDQDGGGVRQRQVTKSELDRS